MRFLTRQFLNPLELCTDKIYRPNDCESRKRWSDGASWSDWVTECHCNTQHTATHYIILQRTALPTAPPGVSEWLSLDVLASCMRSCRRLVAPLNCHVAFWKRNLHKRAPFDRAEFPLIWHVMACKNCYGIWKKATHPTQIPHLLELTILNHRPDPDMRIHIYMHIYIYVNIMCRHTLMYIYTRTYIYTNVYIHVDE